MAHRCATGISAGTEERWVETTDVAGAGLLEAVCPKCCRHRLGTGVDVFRVSGHVQATAPTAEPALPQRFRL